MPAAPRLAAVRTPIQRRSGRTATLLLPLLAAVLLVPTSASASITGGTAAAAATGGAAAASVPGDGLAHPLGPDVSGWQHPNGAAINWRAVAGAGQTFAYVKATEGSAFTNPYLPADWAGIAAAGMARGAYHYARPAYPLSTAADQARSFVRFAGPMNGSGDLPPALDLESGSLSPGDLVTWAHLFLDTVQQLTGRRPVIYTYAYFWRTAMANNTSFTSYPLWIADYSGAAAPGLVGGWRSWTFWQYTSTGSLPGIVGPVDLNRYCCGTTLDAFALRATSAILARYAALGGSRSFLGAVTSAEYAVNGGRAQNFQGGSIYWSAATGPHVVMGAIRDRYWALGGSFSPLGLPVTDELGVPVGDGRYNHFAGGSVYWSPATGAHVVWGAIRDDWAAQGWEQGPLGYPVTDETGTPDGAGRYNHFTGGSVYWSAGTGAHTVRGAIHADWAARGWERSALGYPVTDEFAVPGGAQSNFQHGALRWSAATNAVTVVPR